MLVRTELVVDNDIRNDALRDVIVNVHSESRKIQEDIERMFHKYIGTMSDAQIKNQMAQVINYEYNYLGFSREDLASLMANVSMILSEHTNDKEFLNSLKRSVECTVDGDIKRHLDELKRDNNKSFMIVNILLNNHAFNGIIYKRSDNSYKFVAVNKGYRPRKSQYEAYIIPKDNINYLIENCFGFFELQPNIGMQDAYKMIENKGEFVPDEKVNASVSNVVYNELSSRNQKNGNCFYKNAEAAFLLAWHTSFNKDERATAPKGPISKKDMHIKFMKNIKGKARREVLEYADKEINIYRRNKEFREYLKKNSDVTMDEKRRSCVKIFLDEGKKLSEAEVEAKIDDVLKIVDLETLKNNREIFLVSDNVELVTNVCKITDKLKYIDFLDEEELFELKDKFYQHKESLYKYFPNVADHLKKSIATAIQSKFIRKHISKDTFDAIMELNEDDIMFYLLGENFEEYTKSKEEKLKKICSIIPNHQAAKLEYMYVLLNGNKLREALDEWEIMVSKDEESVILMDILEEILDKINKEGKLKYVVKKYNEYIATDKQKAMAHYGLGISYWLLGDERKAHENFEKAGKLDFKYNEHYLRFLQGQEKNDEVIAKSDELLKVKECRSIKVLKATAIVKNAISDKGIGNLNYAKEVFTNEIDSKYNNELEYFLRGLCNVKLGLLEEALDDLNKVNTLDSSMVEHAIALTYSLGFRANSIKRCGDYLTTNPDDKVIALLEDDIIADLEREVECDIISTDDVRQIFEDAISIDNVDHFSEVKNRTNGLCSNELKDVVVKRLCERENIPMQSENSKFYEYVDGAVGLVKSLWKKMIANIWIRK